MAIVLNRLFDIPASVYKHFGEKQTVFREESAGKVTSTTAREYFDQSNRFSHFLLNEGLSKGDRVVTLIHNSPQWNIAEIGILQAGGVHVPLSPLYSTKQLEYMLELVKPAWIFTSSKVMKHQLQKIVDELSLDCSSLNLKDEAPFNYRGTANSLEARKKSISASDVAVILFTSGSTGLPKGTVLTHKNILTAVHEFSQIDAFKACERSISFLPLNHSAERKVNYCCQINGIAVSYPPSHKNLLENILFFEPQVTAMVPYLLNELRQQMESADQPVCIKNILCGGAAVPVDLIEWFKEKDINVFEVYGLTETASLLTYNTLDHYKLGSVGKVAEAVDLKIADDGEVLVKGGSVMEGYLSAGGAIDNARDKAGWFHTGDMGQLDEQGFLKITGKKKNAFKNSRGAYVYPEAIEQELLKNPLFEDVIIMGDNADALSVILKLKDAQDDRSMETVRETIYAFNEGKNDELKITKFIVLNGGSSEGFFSDTMMKLDRGKIAEQIKNYTFTEV